MIPKCFALHFILNLILLMEDVAEARSRKQRLEMLPKGPIRTCRKSWECRYGADCNENNTCVCTHHCKGQKQFPVCASNRHTYKNLCKLKKASCMQQRPITIKCHGDCDTCLS
ncbi:unnamed protein product [Clavelina lepadiformis]|uniref:Kazal-like domain-containing protein n=1 Tax=Clavelina lepadiformis TaxID=159417 RepID=A0ABP0GV58_CLALP